MAPRWIAHPRLSFAELDVRLSENHWFLTGESQTAPIIPGEPEFATYEHRNQDATISYTYNPAVGLRVLAFSGARAWAAVRSIAALLPGLKYNDVRLLLASGDVRDRLLGLYASGERPDIRLLELVSTLMGDEDSRVRKAARTIHERLFKSAVSIGLEVLSEREVKNPRVSAHFPVAGPPGLRRQIVRWWIHDRRSVSEGLRRGLRAALTDEDWEVRATALLAVARLGVRDIGIDLRKIELPSTSKEGLHAHDRSMLKAMRRACIEQLRGTPRTDGRSSNEYRRTLRRAVAGDLDPLDYVGRWMYSLGTPLRIERDPGEIPSALKREGHRLYLLKTGIRMLPVTVTEHILGLAESPLSNPPRIHSPEQPYLVAERPLSTHEFATLWALRGAVGNTVVHPKLFGSNMTYETWIGSRQDAVQVLKVMSQVEGVELELPTPDEWEMAARGPDARLCPSGNSVTSDTGSARSPWGLWVSQSTSGEWTTQAVCGGDRACRCGWRRDGELAAVRPLVRVR